jgi:hypothetical protein
LKFYDSLICIFCSRVVPLGLTFVYSSWLDTSVLVRLPQMKIGNILFCNLPPFLKFCLRILHLVFHPHQGIIL